MVENSMKIYKTILQSISFKPYKAGELSLMAALCNGDLVKSHMKLGRVQPEPQAKSDVL